MLINLALLTPFCVVIGQIDGNSKLTLEDVIPFELYAGKDYVFGDIILLKNISDSKILWVTKDGLIAIYDLELKEIINKTNLDKTIDDVIFNLKENVFIISYYGNISEYTFKDNIIKEINKIYELDNIWYNNLVSSDDYNSLIAITADSIIVFWDKINGDWKKNKMKVDFSPFTIAYYTNDIIYVGDYDGQLYSIDIVSKKIIKKVKVFKETILGLSFSPDNKKLAIFSIDKVKHCTGDLKTLKTIRSHIEYISCVQWLNENEVIIGGIDNGIEMWSVPQTKLTYYKNVDIRPKHKIIEKAPLPSGISYVNLTDEKFKNLTFVKKYAKITALHINTSGYMAVAKENIKVSIYDVKNNKLQIKGDCNLEGIVDIVPNVRIDDIQIQDSTVLYVGSTESRGHYNFVKNKSIYKSSNYWYNNNQIDYSLSKDVSIIKSDNKFEKFKEALIKFDIYRYYSKKRKRSKLNKSVRNKSMYGNVGLGTLVNPSGFNISKDKNLLVTYDSLGMIQLFDINKLEVKLKTKITEFPIVSAFFYKEDNLAVFTQQEGFILYKFNNNNKLIKKCNTMFEFSFDKISFNKKHLVALYDKDSIHIYDLIQNKIVGNIYNKDNNFQIELVKFVPFKNNLVWVLNEKTKKIKVKEDVSTYSRMNTIGEVLVKKNKIFFGNSSGDILIYKIN